MKQIIFSLFFLIALSVMGAEGKAVHPPGDHITTVCTRPCIDYDFSFSNAASTTYYKCVYDGSGIPSYKVVAVKENGSTEVTHRLTGEQLREPDKAPTVKSQYTGPPDEPVPLTFNKKSVYLQNLFNMREHLHARQAHRNRVFLNTKHSFQIVLRT